MISRSQFVFSSFAAVLLVTGCRRETIHVYIAPKDQPTSAAPAEAPHGHPAVASQPSSQEGRAQRSRPQLSWTLPPNWTETEPGQVSAAQFLIKSDTGEASVNITPLPNLAGKEALVINMWREQVGQLPLEQDQVATALSPVEIGGEKGELFEISGNREGTATRIVTAMLHRPDASWFFKLAGNEAGVEAQKPVFVGFLKSVRIGTSEARQAHGGQPVPATSTSEAPAPSQPVPAAPAPEAPAPNQPVPVQPVPEAPAPSQPVPVQPVPEAPVPSQPVPAAPAPEAPAPSQPVPAAPAPEAPAPSQPVPAAPAPEAPVPSQPVPAQPVPEAPSQPQP